MGGGEIHTGGEREVNTNEDVERTERRRKGGKFIKVHHDRINLPSIST